MRTGHLIAMIVLLACAITSCQAAKPIGPPTGTGVRSSEVTGTARPSPSGAPPVTRPLDATGYRNKPCELLTSQQIAANALDRPSAQYGAESAECIYPRRQDSRELIWVRYYFDADWLNRIYRGKAEPWSFYRFVPMQIAGQPAVRYEKPNDLNDCRVAVGLSASQAVDVSFVGADSCEHAVAIAEVIVHNLGG